MYAVNMSIYFGFIVRLYYQYTFPAKSISPIQAIETILFLLIHDKGCLFIFLGRQLMKNFIATALMATLVTTSLSGCILSPSGDMATDAARRAGDALAAGTAKNARLRAERSARHRAERKKRRKANKRRSRRVAGGHSSTNCLIASPHALAEAADALEDRKSIKRFLPKDGSSSQKDQKKLFETMGIENIYGSGGGGGGC